MTAVYKILKKSASPQTLFAPFSREPYPFLLESAKAGLLGRYSFFGSRPFCLCQQKAGRTFLIREGQSRQTVSSLSSVLREYFREYHLSFRSLPYPFLCGAVGFLSYDLGLAWEGIRRKNPCSAPVPDAFFAFYDAAVCFDHRTRETILFSSGFPDHGKAGQKRARRRLEEMECTLNQKSREKIPTDFSSAGPCSNFSKKAYLAAVQRAKAYIADGDIYQVNLSQRFCARTSLDDWQLYRRLTKCFPVSFSAFLRADDFSVISASPERFLDFDGREVSTRPMKGTRLRTGDKERDERNKKDLIGSAKEKAELLMVVDLERNDLGRVCDYGSIRLSRRRDIESYRTVFQATSEVRGRLHPSKDRWDLLRACFPGGSVTGCPKIRALEIIEELEPEARGIYTGSLGYISFHDTLQFNVLIRTLLKIRDQVTFHVGGGIVADSDPLKEYEETLIKARVLFEALTGRQKV